MQGSRTWKGLVILLGGLATLGTLFLAVPSAQAHGLEITNPASPLVVIGKVQAFDAAGRVVSEQGFYSFRFTETATVPAEALASPEATRNTFVTRVTRGSDGQLRERSQGTLDLYGIFRTDEDLKGFGSGTSDVVVVLPGASLPAMGPGKSSGSLRCPPLFEEQTCFSRDDAIQHGVPELVDRSLRNQTTVSLTFHLTHLPPNQPPTAAADAYEVFQETTLNVVAPGVLGNDTDPEANQLTAVLVSSPAHGSLALNADGSFAYTPTLPEFTGTDTFSYTANDGTAQSSPATVTITVKPLPAPSLSLSVEPDRPRMGQSYVLKATITNNADVPIRARIDWAESQLSGFREPEQHGSRLVPLASRGRPGDQVTVTLGTFSHTWDWLLSSNPLLTAPETLQRIYETIRDARATGRLDELLTQEGLTLTAKLIEVVNGLDEAFFPSFPRAEVMYSATAVYGPAEATDLRLLSNLQREFVTLRVSQLKEGYFLLSQSTAYVGAVSTVTAIGLLVEATAHPELAETFTSPALAFLVSQVGLLEQSRGLYDLAADPPDPNFSELAILRPLDIPEVQQIPQGPWRTLAITALDLQALAVAEKTSRERALGALDAGDPTWASRQLLAASNFAAEASLRYGQFLQLLSLLQPIVTQHALPQADEVIRHLETQGLPEVEIRHLAQLGWSVEQLAVLRQSLIQLGTPPLDDPETTRTALGVASLAATHAAQDALGQAIVIRTSQLSQTVRDLTTEERTALETARDAITAGLDRKIPSPSLRTAIETFLADVRRLAEETNNIASLQPYLDFGFSALAQFQQFGVSLPGLRTLVDALEQSGGITHYGIANSLRDKLADAEEELAEGDFEDVRGILGAFLNEVRAQRDKKISAAAADDLTAYASYLREFFP